jgi:hypothetical protein
MEQQEMPIYESSKSNNVVMTTKIDFNDLAILSNDEYAKKIILAVYKNKLNRLYIDKSERLRASYKK